MRQRRRFSDHAEPLQRSDFSLLKSLRRAFPGGRPEGLVLAAVSGGSDSMAMLELLALARGKGDCDVRAAYVDHRLRREASIEAAVVAATAARHGIEATRLVLDGDGIRDEAGLRSRRYALLESLARSLGARWIATGHTRDDQMETVLLRLFRGAGRRGMAGIPARSGAVIRPLLELRRTELRAFLRRRGVAWLEDATNRDLAYTRNRLRHEVLPVIERSMGKAALDRLPLLAERWASEESYLCGEAQRFALFALRQGHDGHELVDLAALERAPRPLRGRILRDWLERSSGRSISIAQVSAVERLARARSGSSAVSVAGLRVVREYELLRVEAPANRQRAARFFFRLPCEGPACFVAPSGQWQLRVGPGPSRPPAVVASPCCQTIDIAAAQVRRGLVLRPNREGDRIEVEVGKGRRKVRDIMGDRRVPEPARCDWPVLAAGPKVLWLPGMALATELVAAPNGERVRLSWQRKPLF